MEYDSYVRSPGARPPTRDRDEYRSSDAYRDNRRRSPDRRRGGGDRDRRRSRSPANIDRYQPDRVPRDDYYGSRDRDDRRERRRSSPQPPSIDRYVPGMPDPAPPALLVNPMPDPMKLDFQVGFTWFAEWWRTEQRIKDEKERQKAGKPPQRLRGERETREEKEAERPKIQAAYDQYKENLQKSQAQTFVRLHKDEDWFRERYEPEFRDPYRRRLMEYRQGLFAHWEQDLASGTFDDFTLEGIYKSESNGFGGILEKEEGEAPAAAEVLGVGDLLPSKGGELRDPMAMQPTLLVKTIAPTVSREKFEAFAKEHLGEEEGGFKHISLSDPNPLKRCHRMGWIILHPASQQEEDSSGGADREDGEADGDMKMDLANPLQDTSSKALARIDGKTIEDAKNGDFIVHCGVHRPPDAPRKKALWDLFSAPERIARDVELATRLVRRLDNELGEEYFGVAKIEERVQQLAESGMLQPPAQSKPIKDDDMDEDAEEGEEEEGMIDEDESDDEELLIKKKKLDLLVEYLRRVYNFCFFCVFESDSVHELQRKCTGGHLRRPRSSLTSAAKEVARASANGEAFPLKKGGRSESNNAMDAVGMEDGEMALDPESPVEERKMSMLKPSAKNAQQLQRAFNWVKTFEEKILQIIDPESVNLEKLGGVPTGKGVEEELIKWVKQEDHNKYRCKVLDCTKLFKGVEFWRKHVEKRHTEWYDKIHSDVELVNRYVLDPSHIAPSRSDANSNGHFPLNNPNMPTGTPRGFQLNQHMVPGMFGLPPGMPPPNAMNAMFNNQLAGWAPAAGMAAGISGMQGGVGPIRNHGRGPMNGFGRMPGPYARHDGKGRMPSMSGGRGPPMPMMGMPGTGAGGMEGTMEAVAGRTVKSYEDLDAAGGPGEGTAELDY